MSWWKEEIVYQIYPRSFKDSNGDGIGDLNGIREKLDYLKDLGVTCIWLSPVYKSPMDDNGYDISDYRDINEEFGTLDEFKLLLDEAHAQGIKVLMDLVVNHTSDEHPWFVESRKSKDNPYRDYYIWRDGKPGNKPPSDWGSHFFGSAWEYDDVTGQYYLHLFSKKQPDLNWENPKVRQEIYDMMRFWCDMGVDGYRIDTVLMYSKHPDFPDTGEPYRLAHEYFMDGPHMLEYIKEMNREVFSRYDIMTVGEAGWLPIERIAPYVSESENALNMAFQFEHAYLDREDGGDWSTKPQQPLKFKRIMSRWQRELPAFGGWNSLYLSNHDQSRQVSKYGNDGEFRVESAKMLATLILTQQGTPFIYQGEEIGMTNCTFAEDEYKDVSLLNFFAQCRVTGEDITPHMPGIVKNNRDNARTPMQWDDSVNAGFTEAEPWIKVNPNYMQINVKESLADPESVLAYYKALLSLRKQHPVFVHGDFQEQDEDNESVYIYSRNGCGEKIVVLLNLTAEAAEYKLEDKNYNQLMSNYKDPMGVLLRPYEAVILKADE